MAARRIGHAVDLTVRAARQVLPQRRVLSFVRRERRPEYTQAPHGLIIHQGEVGLDRATESQRRRCSDCAPERSPPQRGLVLSPVTADNLGAHAPPIADPVAGRGAGAAVRAAGPAARPCSRSGSRSTWPAASPAGSLRGSGISARPQHNPVHRHTVDRHSVQTRGRGRSVTSPRSIARTCCCSPACCTTSASCPARASAHPRSVRRSPGQVAESDRLARGRRRPGRAAGPRAPDAGRARHPSRPRRPGHRRRAGRGRRRTDRGAQTCCGS